MYYSYDLEVEKECLRAYDEGRSRPFQAIIDELKGKEIDDDNSEQKKPCS